MKHFTSAVYIFLALSFTAVSLAILPAQVSAQGLVKCGNGQFDKTTGRIPDACTIADLFNTVVRVTNFLIAFAGLVAVVMLVWAGLDMVLAAGNPGSYAKAKKKMTGAIGGFVLVALAFVIVNTLVSGSLKLGIKNGTQIFTDPKGYIQGGDAADKSN